ncbi:MAG: hypothetical protein MMC33_002019 [Icmadophila ericetorum]|nr:hypothetical protein [Icmadophila ericetorum]
MSPTPISPDVRATPNRVNSDSPSTSVTPQQRYGRQPHHSDTSIFTRLHIRTGRSRSRSANRASSSAIVSPTSTSPTTPYDERARFAQRVNSSDSSSSSSSLQSRSREKRHSGTVTPCGRHANEWLFNDFSVRETIRNTVRHISGDHSGDHGHGHHRGGSS